MARPRSTRFKALLPAMVREVSQVMYAAGDEVASEAHLLITRGSVSGKGHTPSAPGAPPQNDTGVLARGIQVHQTAPMKVQIVSTAPYSNALEYGTSKMEERPFMRPALRIAEPAVNKIIGKAARRAVRRFPGGR